MTIKLVTFLGNPGREYEKTRHNIGQMLVNEAPFLSNPDWQNKFKGLFTQSGFNSQKIYFLQPQTYMNKSGESVLALMQFYKIKPGEILVVHDEIELDFGQVDFKKGGGLAGHNGLRSISSALGTKDFFRFRLGISRPVHGDVSSYVLGKFNREQHDFLPVFLQQAAIVLEEGLKNGMQTVMNKYQKKILI